MGSRGVGRIRLLTVAFAGVLTSGCAVLSLIHTPPPAETHTQREAMYAPVASVYDYHGPEGFGRWYFFTATHVVLVMTNDFGRPFREAYKKELTPSDAASIRDFIQSRDSSRLKEWYVTPDVYDGLQVTVKLYASSGPPKVVHIANAFDPYVYEIFAFLDQFLEDPYKMKIGANIGASFRYRDPVERARDASDAK